MTQTVTEKIITGQTDEHITFIENHIGVHINMLSDFLAMQKAAQIDGIDLRIASGFRDFARQKSIFERKLEGLLPVYDLKQNKINLEPLSVQDKIKHILLFTALPGASRHHWGSDIDVYAPNLLAGKTLQLQAWEYDIGGPMEKLNRWLDENMSKFGFFKPYRVYQNGVAPEPWHISYRPLAQTFQQALTCAQIARCLQKNQIKAESELLNMLDWIYQHYIINISD